MSPKENLCQPGFHAFTCSPRIENISKQEVYPMGTLSCSPFLTDPVKPVQVWQKSICVDLLGVALA